MRYDELIVLIPSHGLEDFPTELGEKQAAGLLNAFAAVWHPLLLRQARGIPFWYRADLPPEDLENRLFVVPAASESALPSGWVSEARRAGAVVLVGLTDREELTAAALEPLDDVPHVADEFVADFHALGTAWLQMELLTRQMHHYSNADESQLQREATAAAEAAIADDAEAVRAHLRECFETLMEVRERFYPVDCYLLDLCLLIPRLADAHLERLLASEGPVNYLVAAADLERIAEEHPELIAEMKSAWNDGRADLIGGEWKDAPTPLMPVESVLWQLRRGRAAFHRLFARVPRTWGRRRYGLTPLLPEILDRFAYHSALHLVMDDGIYPDAEQSKIRWEGCDGTVLDAITRIPLAADSAASYLRFAQRMSESMEQDHVAAVLFAHWPEMKSPWLNDLRRMHSYLPVLGRFVSMDEFVEQTDTPGRLSRYEAEEYLTPFLIQAAARREADPVSRFAGHLSRRARFDAACWFRSLATVVSGGAIDLAEEDEQAAHIENVEWESDPEAASRAEEFLDTFTRESAERLREIVMAGSGERPGYLVFNPLSFTRRVAVELPELEAAPRIEGPVKAVQFDDERRSVLLELPGSGFVWLPRAATAEEENRDDLPQVAEEDVLRNEFLEVHLNPETGGISRIKEYGRRPNRLSQQLAFRFPHEKTVPAEEAREPPTTTLYSTMRRRHAEITSTGPGFGEIVSTGDLVDPTDGTVLADFRQTVRLWRGRRTVEIDIELDVQRMPEGDPWSNYFASRFAWNDSAAAVTRSVQQGAHGFRGERIESPWYLEIADETTRTTIVPHGLPFHRKSGPRMIDTILACEGETRRRFRFEIAVDADYPLQPALDALAPATIVETGTGPPRIGRTGWFFHLDAKNVQLTRLAPLPVDVPPRREWERDPTPEASEPAAHDRAKSVVGFVVRLLETEGRHRQIQLRCFRTPSAARQCDFQGETIANLRIEGDTILLDLTPYEIADVELRFGGAG